MTKISMFLVISLSIVTATNAADEMVALREALLGTQSGYITYSQYGAIGNGVADDFDAIIKAHAAANAAGLPVRAEPGAWYYIGASTQTAQIQTDTDWRDARFIIDDSKVAGRARSSHVFHISSKLPSISLTSHVLPFKKGQEKLVFRSPPNLIQDAFVVAQDDQTMRFARRSSNRLSNGVRQTDVFLIDKDGNVDPTTPIVWDFDNISEMTAYPIDHEMLTIKGGHFTTIANRVSGTAYFHRNVLITRSNAVIDGIRFAVIEETETRSPYRGLQVIDSTNVTVQHAVLASQMATGSGTYGFNISRSNNVTLKNCKQTADINDARYWGVFASYFSKNLTFDTVEFSRFDAHEGVTNAIIRNSVLGHQGINLIGHGTFFVENTKVCGNRFINLRRDYGSWFDGEIVVRNCEFLPNNGRESDAILIGGGNSGQSNFKQPCIMPRKITIDGFVVHDINPPSGYSGPKIFANFTPNYTEATVQNGTFEWQYPFLTTEEVEIRNLTIKSGKPLNTSANEWMFRNTVITIDSVPLPRRNAIRPVENL